MIRPFLLALDLLAVWVAVVCVREWIGERKRRSRFGRLPADRIITFTGRR